MLTKDQIKRGRALCKAATPGPWHERTPRHPEFENPAVHHDGDADDGCLAKVWGGQSNAAFIAEARALLPAALDEVERVTAERDLARQARDGYHADIDVQQQVIRELRAQIEQVAALLPRYRAALPCRAARRSQ